MSTGQRKICLIVIEDRAKQVDPGSIQSRDLDDIRPGGLGVYIMREVMDEVVFEQREGGGMRLRMLKRTAGIPSTPAVSSRVKDSS